MPRIDVPEMAEWYEQGKDKNEIKIQKEFIIDSKSYWVLGGGIILFLFSILIMFIFTILCW